MFSSFAKELKFFGDVYDIGENGTNYFERCCFHFTSGKGLNPSDFHPATGKYYVVMSEYERKKNNNIKE